MRLFSVEHLFHPQKKHQHPITVNVFLTMKQRAGRYQIHLKYASHHGLWSLSWLLILGVALDFGEGFQWQILLTRILRTLFNKKIIILQWGREKQDDFFECESLAGPLVDKKMAFERLEKRLWSWVSLGLSSGWFLLVKNNGDLFSESRDMLLRESTGPMFILSTCTTHYFEAVLLEEQSVRLIAWCFYRSQLNVCW